MKMFTSCVLYGLWLSPLFEQVFFVRTNYYSENAMKVDLTIGNIFDDK